MTYTVAPITHKTKRVDPSEWLMDASICLAALTASWSAVSVGGFNVVDWLTGLTLAFALGARMTQRRPIYISFWMLAPGLAALLVESIATFTSLSDSFNHVMVLRVFLATLVLAVIVQSFAIANPSKNLLRLLKWWAAGIAVSAVFAVLSATDLIDLSDVLVQASGYRVSGLAAHPNGLAFSLAIVFPVLCYFVRTTPRPIGRFAWLLGLCVSAWAMFLSDSRSGLLVGMFSLGISVVIMIASTRGRILMVPLLIAGGISSYNLIPALLAESRLFQGAEQSDLARTQINDRAFAEFLNNPLVGSGFSALSGVAVPLQLISAGGLLLTFSYYLFVLRPLPIFWTTRDDLLSRTAFLVLFTLLAFGVFNPIILERAAFWPALVALYYARSLAGTLPSREPWEAPRP